MKKVLIIGGYGVFGQRICERLCRIPDITLVIAGRSQNKADALKNRLSTSSQSTIETIVLDVHDIRNADIDADVLINASGPYHEQDYRLAEYCIERGIHYIDLADNRKFVCGINQLDEATKKQNVLVTSGASTVPALSSAVLDHYQEDFSEIHSIDYGVTPGNQTDRGVGTVAAILSYVGKRFQTLMNGKPQDVIGWQNLHREHYPEIGKRWMSNCNIPDLDLFEDKYPALKTQRFYAGLELSVLHVGLWLLSWPSRWGWMKRPEKMANFLRTISLWFYPLGSQSGGMHVKLEGVDHQKQPVKRQWYLIAKNGDGPYIPATPSVLLVKKLLAGDLKQRGAMPCMSLFSLNEFMEELTDLDIVQHDHHPLYKRLLGERYTQLPKAVQTVHNVEVRAIYEGQCDVERGRHPFCKFLAWMMSLPPDGKSHPLKVEFVQDGAVEIWTRHFGDQKFVSRQYDRNSKLYEGVNGITLVFDIETTTDKLRLKLSNVLLFGIPVKWLFQPKVIAEEREENGKFCMNIDVHMPFFGSLVKYNGWLKL